jgi:hypothetical protein
MISERFRIEAAFDQVMSVDSIELVSFRIHKRPAGGTVCSAWKINGFDSLSELVVCSLPVLLLISALPGYYLLVFAQ